MNPGVANLPVASITRAPLGTGTVARGPIAAIRRPRTTMMASGIAGPPLPSITVAPTIAITLSVDAIDCGTDASAIRAVGAACARTLADDTDHAAANRATSRTERRSVGNMCVVS